MFGVVLAAIGAFFEELSCSVAKRQVTRKKESVYAMGFLNALLGFLFFLVFTFGFRDVGALTFHAWPTFLVRVIFSVFQAYLTVHAITKADRSTFGFIRTGTIPLLLVGDIFFGTFISGYQMLGMAMISIGLLFLFMNHGFSKKGIGYVVLSALNAAVTIGIYKYDITHGNSVELEQLFGMPVLLLFFYLMSRYRMQERPLALLKKPMLLLQSGSVGIASIVESFAYVFAPASVILAASRSSTVVLTVLSGRVYFHEKKLSIKLFSLAAFVAGIILLAVG